MIDSTVNFLYNKQKAIIELRKEQRQELIREIIILLDHLNIKS